MKQIVLSLVLAGLVPAAWAGEYIPAGGPPVKDQYIVVLKNEMPPSEREALLNNLAKEHKGKVSRVFKHVLNGGLMTLSQAKAEALAHNANVLYVEQDSTVWTSGRPSDSKPSDTQLSTTWGLDRIDQRNLPLDGVYTYTTTATDVTAYVIDTGIRISHTEFGGRASIGIDVIGGSGSGGDCVGHGTHVAGTIGGNLYGVAKEVKLISVRVLGCDGSGYISGVIAGVDWATEDATSSSKTAVANMSLIGGGSLSLDNAVIHSIQSGVTYALAAGNSNKDACRYSPARINEPGALTVAASTAADARASYSNYGKCVDIFAPGSSITSAWNSSDTALNTISGTSMATPHVAGVAALYLQTHAGAKPDVVGNGLVNEATLNKLSNIKDRKTPNALLYSLIP